MSGASGGQSGRMPAGFHALTHAGYRLYFIGMLLRGTAVWMQLIGLPWLAVELGATPFELGVVTAAQTLPFLAIAPVGGVIADRVNRGPRADARPGRRLPAVVGDGRAHPVGHGHDPHPHRHGRHLRHADRLRAAGPPDLPRGSRPARRRDERRVAALDRVQHDALHRPRPGRHPHRDDRRRGGIRHGRPVRPRCRPDDRHRRAVQAAYPADLRHRT